MPRHANTQVTSNYILYIFHTRATFRLLPVLGASYLPDPFLPFPAPFFAHDLCVRGKGLGPRLEWLCVPSGKRMNVDSNPAVGAGFFFWRGKLLSATDTEQVWP